jgi:hypothetical protein
MPALRSGCSRSPAISLQSAEVTVAESDSKSGAYEFRTKSAQSGGLETNGGRERISDLSRHAAVRRFSREACGYWASMRARKPAENVGRGKTGGARAPGIQRSPFSASVFNTIEKADARDYRLCNALPCNLVPPTTNTADTRHAGRCLSRMRGNSHLRF